jgi:hypothetical protein
MNPAVSGPVFDNDVVDAMAGLQIVGEADSDAGRDSLFPQHAHDEERVVTTTARHSGVGIAGGVEGDWVADLIGVEDAP